MTSKELAAGVIFPRLSLDKYRSDSVYQKEIEELCRIGIGGFCIFGGDAETAGKIIDVLQKMTVRPLLICADFEHGLPMRLEGGTDFPHALALGKNKNPAITREIARSIALEMKSIGVHWNLAPVCDINSNKNNPIINIRSFGETPDEVIPHVVAYIEGTQSEGIIACAKHFPGHGDTAQDSHSQLPVINSTLRKLEANELKPFTESINAGVRSIMAGHLVIPSLEKENIPASLSYTIITELLKKKLSYSGLVVTDALDMKAVTDNFKQDDVVIRAVNAGADILLMPEHPLTAINVLAEMAKKDELFRLKLNISYNKIIDEKKICGLSEYRKPDFKLKSFKEAHEKLALKAAYNACGIFGDKTIIELKENENFAAFSFVLDNIEQGSSFFRILAQATENNCDFGYIDENISLEELIEFQNGIKTAYKVIFAIFSKPTAYKSLNLQTDKINKIIEMLSDGRRNIVILFGNPYLRDEIKARATICTYSDSLPGIAATVLRLVGKTPEILGI
jgi:beta-N-acetylhexosaminidase